jgi:chemosensory pili system protein ChpB (putative protein-glutamate methylesterase)
VDNTLPAAARVALMAEQRQREQLRLLLEKEGMEVVLDEELHLPLPRLLNGAEVLLVGSVDRIDRDRVRGVLRESPVPVLLNHGDVEDNDIWQRRLMGKLKTLASRSVPNASIHGRRSRPELRVIDSKASADSEPPTLVVLGASIGGPKSVARFLRALPEDLPVSFLLAQHISEPFQDLLAEQLDRCSVWPVALLGQEQSVGRGNVWLVPADNGISLDEAGSIRRSNRPWQSAHRPDINQVLELSARTLGRRCGAIMFSGLGKDGVEGCASVMRHGGFVWAQSPESCVISNMPENARRSCNVELSGTPEELAQALTLRCQLQSAGIN